MILELKKIAVICLTIAFADSLFLIVLSVVLRGLASVSPGSLDIQKQIFVPVVYVLGIAGVAAFCGFALSAIGFVAQVISKNRDY